MARIETPRPIRGTQDIFGADQRRFGRVVDAFERIRRLYCFSRVELPVFESTAVFARSLGETTDVVSKEMYSFEDRGGDSLTLRPEFTAGIARAYLTDGWQQFAPLKIATHGPVFRYERPQKGRYRQFHQIDAEVIGAAEPGADVELLAFADQLLHELGIADGVTLQLNTLGDAETRDAWRAALVAHFEAHRDVLSEDSLARLDKNPLRILDSKDPRDRPVADSAPGIDDYLTSEARDFFAAVTAGLDAAGVAWTRNDRLVRGLDYYRHTAFEFVTDRLGAQGTVLAGGRYDGLIGSLGGPETPGVGWAAGIERLAMLLEEPSPDETTVNDVAVISGGSRTDLVVQRIVPALRKNASARFDRPLLSVEGYLGRSRNKLFEKARKKSAAMLLLEDSAGGELATLRFWTGRFGVPSGKFDDIVGSLRAGGFDIIAAETNLPYSTGEETAATGALFYLIERA
ncbi:MULTISPECIES: histidine--tRNA ligase [Sphingomonas]|uniref:histidine--tRNA ligase n=1 Tax=Sphingomonas TaxID=13687 RepID=UPI001F49BB5F|nr:histidine--tRNA ligase [Sphingomonas sp. ABOLF]GLK19842.1 histidine--tRNA ligase [Microbacterium terregens]